MSELLEVEGDQPVWSDGHGRFGQSDRFFYVGGVKDGVLLNGSRWNCRLTCLWTNGKPDALVGRFVRLFAAYAHNKPP